MKAAVYERYGAPEVVRIREVPTPAPGEGELLIRIRATTVTSADHRARSLDMPPGFGLAGRLAFGLLRPRQPILGTELAGEVEAVGRGVLGLRAGDAVIAFADARMGCHAEYRCLAEDAAVVPKPPRLSWEEAAALPFGALTALHFLRRAGVAPGEKVLVNGASGAVGVACVQLARHLGAEVTGVCSAANLELVRSLGAAHLVDYTREDFTTSGQAYDVIVDTVGTAPWARSRASLAFRGRFVPILSSLADMLRAPWVSARGGARIVAGVSPGTREALRAVVELAEAGALRPVVDRCFPLDQIVEAHRYVDTGRKRGSVVVTVA